MKIGFPVVTDSGTVLRVQVWITRPVPGVSPCVRCYVHSTPESGFLTLQTENPTSSDSYRRPIGNLLNAGFDVNLRLLGGMPEERQAQVDTQSAQLLIKNASGSLCFELLSVAGERSVDTLEFNVSGVCQEHKLRPLLPQLPTEANRKDVIAKISAAVREQWHLWIAETDLEAVKSQLALTTKELACWIHPFRAPQQGINWLIAELNEHYQVVLPTSDAPPEPIYGETTHALFNAALPSEDLTDERAFTLRKQTYLAKNPARNLLEVQKRALEECKDIFYSAASARRFNTRHVLISGPTGCGKTALVKLIALNGIVERNGGVLYIGPIRALVDDFDASFKDEFGELLGNDYCGTEAAPRIVMSSGDVSKDDGAISRGEFALASIVNEKANVLLSAGGKLLERVSIVILDELHMVSEPFRGGVLDLLLTKLLREARRRDVDRQQNTSIRPLQIVGISTEGIAREISSYDSFAFGDGDSMRPPVSLFVTERPVSVQHKLGVFFDKARHDRRYELRDIVDFKNNKHRELVEESADFYAQFSRTFNNSSYWPTLTSVTSDTPYDEQFIELLVDRARAHSTLIAAIPGIRKLESLASALWKRFSHVLDQRATPPSFEIAIKAAGLTRERRDQLLQWARRGVFVHHGQYPRVLRREVERIFAIEDPPNARHRVLLTTETLSYGVNLSASCVILYSKTWTRDDVHEPFARAGENKDDLTPNEYHNLLGRAGRLGRQHAALNEAIVCVHSRELPNVEKKKEFLRSYYTEHQIGRPASGAVTMRDLTERLTYDRKEKRFDLRTGCELSDFTYPCFRTVMDALRSVQGQTGASAAKVYEFLKDSLAYQSLLDSGHQARFGAMVEHILRLSDEYQKDQNLALVLKRNEKERSEKKYVIQLPGSALIDTGTRLESVEPMSRWLDRLVELNLEETPVELVVVGLLCTHDFLKTGIEITAERWAQEPTDLRLQQLSTDVSSELRNEIARLVQDVRAQERLVQAITELADRTIPFSKSPRLMGVAVLRLATQVLMWIRGESLERIEEVGNLGHPSAAASQLQPKHAERLYYLCVMCFRYFDKFDQKFIAGHKSQLPRLAVRLKYGLPSKAIPLFNAFSAEGLLPREGVTLLSSRIASAIELLNPDAAAARDECRQLIANDMLNVSDLSQATKIVRRFYAQQMTAFCSLLADGYNGVAPFVRHAQDILTAAFAPDNAFRIADCLRLQPQLRAPTQFIHREDTANFYEDGGDVSFRVSTTANDNCWKLASWFAPADADGSITPCAYVLIVVLLERGFVGLRDVAQKLSGHNGLVGVRIVVEKLIVPSATESVPVALREGLLAMFEPAMV